MAYPQLDGITFERREEFQSKEKMLDVRPGFTIKLNFSLNLLITCFRLAVCSLRQDSKVIMH